MKSRDSPPTAADAVAQWTPATFDRQHLATTVRWVWFGGYLIPIAVITVAVFQIDLFLIDLFLIDIAGGVVAAATFVALVVFAVWRTATRFSNWTWELTERDVIIDRGVVFKLTRIVPRVRIQHVDISSGPLDRFFGLRRLSIYTAGTREADASIPGLTEDRAEALRTALIGS